MKMIYAEAKADHKDELGRRGLIQGIFVDNLSVDAGVNIGRFKASLAEDFSDLWKKHENICVRAGTGGVDNILVRQYVDDAINMLKNIRRSDWLSAAQERPPLSQKSSRARANDWSRHHVETGERFESIGELERVIEDRCKAYLDAHLEHRIRLVRKPTRRPYYSRLLNHAIAGILGRNS